MSEPAAIEARSCMRPRGTKLHEAYLHAVEEVVLHVCGAHGPREALHEHLSRGATVRAHTPRPRTGAVLQTTSTHRCGFYRPRPHTGPGLRAAATASCGHLQGPCGERAREGEAHLHGRRREREHLVPRGVSVPTRGGTRLVRLVRGRRGGGSVPTARRAPSQHPACSPILSRCRA